MADSSTTWLSLDYFPAFFDREEITCWDMMVNISGEVIHHVKVRHKNAENRWTMTLETRTRWIESRDIDAIEKLIADIGFENFKREYDCSWDDQDWRTLSVVLKERTHRVHVDGAGVLVYHGDQDVQNFLRLWDFIMTFAPSPKEKKRKHYQLG